MRHHRATALIGLQALTGETMKTLYAISAAIFIAALSGCVIVPYDDYGSRGGHHHHRHHR